MEVAEYRDFAEKCFRDTPPPCAAVCPLAYDVREFIRLMRRGSYRSAYKLLRNSMIFPSVAARVCPETCKASCVRGRLPDDRPIDLRELERICCDKMAGKKPERFTMIQKTNTVAVVGGGLSGLACAYRLASFGYQVTVYEKNHLLGGRVCDAGDCTPPGAGLDPEWCHEEILREFSAVNCTLAADTEIMSLADIPADAYYIATGRGGNRFEEAARENIFRGSLPEDPAGEETKERASGPAETAPSESAPDFTGTASSESAPEAIARGLRAAAAIDVWFKIGKAEFDPLPPKTCADARYYDLKYDTAFPETPPEKGEAEAYRCMRCSCSACYDSCPLMEKVRYYPKKVCGEVVLTLWPSLSKRTSVRMLMGCTDCGICREVCPENIDMGKCLMEARADFYESGAMAPAFHDFWLQDMAFSESEEARLLWRPQPEEPSEVLFFPGCQLSASLPETVLSSYRILQNSCKNAAILLGCCGVPAKWAGKKADYDQMRGKIREDWESSGRPLLVTACPSCLSGLKDIDPDMHVISFYRWAAEHPEALPDHGCPDASAAGAVCSRDCCGTVTVMDPCSSVEEQSMAEDVRALLRCAGFTVANPDPEPGCCGFGGHIYNADPGLYHTFAKRRLDGTEGCLVTYCANCRDIFAAEGADACHILSLITRPAEASLADCDCRTAPEGSPGQEAIAGDCGTAPDGSTGQETAPGSCSTAPPELGQRRENRRALRRCFTGEEPEEMEEKITIRIPEEVVRKMDRELVLREQVRDLILEAEESGRKVYDEDDNLYYAHRRFGEVTVWAAYYRQDDEITISNVYLHRMDIREELS